MVLLTITPALVAAINAYDALRNHEGKKSASRHDSPTLESSLRDPQVGNPISHAQVLEISRALQSLRGASLDNGRQNFALDRLLRGSAVYQEPPKPRPRPTSEYKEMMARLRRDEEAQVYNRMVTQPSQPGNSSRPFSSKQAGRELPRSKDEDDEMTYADVNRQITLIINILVTVVACSIAIWLVASHWSAPSRLALSLGGSLLIGIAEVVIYAGYLRRLGEAKSNEKRKTEKKVIMDTWIIERSNGSSSKPLPIDLKQAAAREGSMRHRKQR